MECRDCNTFKPGCTPESIGTCMITQISVRPEEQNSYFYCHTEKEGEEVADDG